MNCQDGLDRAHRIRGTHHSVCVRKRHYDAAPSKTAHSRGRRSALRSRFATHRTYRSAYVWTQHRSLDQSYSRNSPAGDSTLDYASTPAYHRLIVSRSGPRWLDALQRSLQIFPAHSAAAEASDSTLAQCVPLLRTTIQISK